VSVLTGLGEAEPGAPAGADDVDVAHGLHMPAITHLLWTLSPYSGAILEQPTPMPPLKLPADVDAVLTTFYTCEFTTLNARGEPLTWPVEPFFDAEAGTVIATASIAFPVKALNARRNPRVALLYSDPTGSGLSDPPAVLIQGDAHVAEAREWTPQSEEQFKLSVLRQPDSRKFIVNPLVRRLFTFYFQRLTMTVQPRRILVWPHRRFADPPTEILVSAPPPVYVE
jgi:hypothetical protein